MLNKKILLISFISLTLCSYTTTLRGQDLQKTPRISDSITSWISEGRNVNHSLENRDLFLKKTSDAIKKVKNDSLKTKYLSKLSLAYFKLKNYKNFKKINKETLLLSIKIGDSVAQAESYWDMASYYEKVNRTPDSAYYYYSEAHKLYDNLKKISFSARMIYNMANVQADTRDYTGSEINAIKALEIQKTLKDDKRIYMCYNLLGINARRLKAYDRAIEYYNIALKYAEKLDDFEIEKNIILNNIGYAYFAKKDYVTASRYFKLISENKNLINIDPVGYSRALNNLGETFLKQKKMDSLPKLFFNAKNILINAQADYELGIVFPNIAEYYLTQKDTIKALHYAQKTYNLSKINGEIDGILTALKILTHIDSKNATQHVANYIRLSDSLQLAERKSRNKFARIRFETDEFIAENQTLEKQKQLWIGIAVSLLLLAIALFIIIYQRVKNQKLKFLQKQQVSNQEIFNLMLSQRKKIQEGRQIAQKRISEELHDGVLGKMLGARMLLTGLNKRNGETVIKERAKAISALRDIESEVRLISHELNYNSYQKINNFVVSIEELLIGLKKNSGIDYYFSYNQDIEWDELSGDIKINTYRMIQEGIQNSRKHAECTEVFVNFNIYNKKFVIAMGDNGKGFKFDKERKGIGMRNLQSRIKKLNGLLEIESELGKGTVITLTIPIPDNKEKSRKSHLVSEQNKIYQTQA